MSYKADKCRDGGTGDLCVLPTHETSQKRNSIGDTGPTRVSVGTSTSMLKLSNNPISISTISSRIINVAGFEAMELIGCISRIA